MEYIEVKQALERADARIAALEQTIKGKVLLSKNIKIIRRKLLWVG